MTSASRPVFYSGNYSAISGVELAAPSPGMQTLYLYALEISTINGNDFSATLVITNDIGTFTNYSLHATAGCSAGNVIISLSGKGEREACSQPTIAPISGLCQQYLSTRCTGVFGYSTYKNTEGTYILQLSRWCGAIGDVFLECHGEGCGANDIPACDASVTENTFVVEGGQVNVTQSTVIIENGTTATFLGDSITIEESYFTLEQGDSVENTFIEADQSVVNINAPDTSVYNIITNEAGPCGSWANWEMSREENVTLDEDFAPLVLTQGSLDQGEDDDWELVSTSVLSYTGEVEDDAEFPYQFTFCMKSAQVYGATGIGYRMQVALGNVSASAILISAETAEFFNETNPIGVGGGLCGALVTSQLKKNDEFAVYARIIASDGSSVTLVTSNMVFSLAIVPVGCEGTTTVLNITAIFNDTRLVNGTCTTVRAIDSGTIAIDNDGVCSVTIENAPISYWKEVCVVCVVCDV